MPSVALLVPVALPILGALTTALFGRNESAFSRAAASAGVWAAALSVVVLWLPVSSTQELSLGQLGFGSSLELRLDTMAMVFSLVVLVPAATLLTLQPRSWQESTVAALGVAAAVLSCQERGWRVRRV